MRIKITDKQVGTDITIQFRLGIESRFGDANRSPEQLDHVQDSHGVIGIDHVQKFDKAISIVRLRDLVFGHVHRLDAADLRKQLHEECFSTSWIEVANVARGILIAMLYLR